MIKTVINLREVLDEFCDVHAKESMYSDILSSNDWKALEEIKSFLEKIEHTTKALEGSKACIDLTLPNFEFILKIFESTKTLNADNDVIAPMINSS